MPFPPVGSRAVTGIANGLKPFDEVIPVERVRHHFVGQDDAKGVYAKEIHIPKGAILVSHQHTYDHLSILASGLIELTVAGETRTMCGPRAVTIRKGEAHTVLAHTEAVWFCIHPTDETDPAHVDDVILRGS
jgi:quercetin dioxygenase-like cupin family protein